jgi:hypothetical protein
MRTEASAAASEPPVDAGLALAPDPSTPGIVTAYDPDAEGVELASRWLTLDEETLVDVTDWR